MPSPTHPKDDRAIDRRRRGRRALVGLLSLMAVSAAGCSQGVVTSAIPPTVESLRAVRDSYFGARRALNRPPRSKEELLPHLKKYGDPADLLRSPDDGEEFVIVYGTEPLANDSINNVWAYERHGKGGGRWSIRGRNVQRIANDEFIKASFPPNHKPAF
jgi:hypothetical protein